MADFAQQLGNTGWTHGIRDLFGALAGTDQIKERAQSRYEDEMKRRELRDQQVLAATAAAAMAGTKKKSQDDYAHLETDDLIRALTLGGLGTGYKGAQEGIGAGQQNAARAIAETLAGQPTTEANVDQFNRQIGVAGNHMVGPANVRTVPQATAIIGDKNASAAQHNAAAGASDALAGYRDERTAQVDPLAQSLIAQRGAAAGNQTAHADATNRKNPAHAVSEAIGPLTEAIIQAFGGGTAPAAAPQGVLPAAAPDPHGFVQGKRYTDPTTGAKAIYLGNGQWQEL